MNHVDPGYLPRILSAARNDAERRAWSLGSWDAPPTAYFSDVDWTYVKIPSFKVPTPDKIRMSYDHRSAKPFAVLFWWESDGSDIELSNGKMRSTRRGDEYLVGEIYGALKPNVGLKLPIAEIARKIKFFVEAHGWPERICTRDGNIADSNIFDENDARPSLATDFEKAGIRWEKADKGPGSRVQGAEQVHKMLLATKPAEGIREEPGLFVCENCIDWWRTVPNLQRSETNLEDVDDDAEDHPFDATRYRLRREHHAPARSGRVEMGSDPRLRPVH